MAYWSGWFAAVAILVAGLIPLAARMRLGKRATPESGPIGAHTTLGMIVAGFAFLHALFSLLALGSSSAVGAGELALGAGGAALFVLVAHAGIGFQLKSPKLRDRPKKRRTHQITATIIVLCVTAHAVLLWRAS